MSAPSSPLTVQLFGVELVAETLTETTELIVSRVRAGRPLTHSCINAAKVVAMQDDARLAAAVRGCDIVSADGQGIVLAGRILGHRLPERVAGIDLMMRLLAAADDYQLPVYFLGSTAEELEAAVAQVRHRWPRIPIAGYRDGYFPPEDMRQVLDEIRATQPSFLFVGITSPMKEWIVAESEGAATFTMGVGGAIDVLAGSVRRAPAVVQRVGLEWAWRVAQEPRRLWRRYLVSNIRFTALVIREVRHARIGPTPAD